MQRKWVVLAVTSVAVFMSFLDVTIVNIAFPNIESSFPDASLSGLSWIFNAYNIVFAALLLPAGRLGDLLGRRRLFFTGLGTFLAASVACGLAPSPEVLVAARIVQAAGAAMIVPSSLGLILPEFPLSQRATATSIWGAMGAVAAATGPALGGVLVHATSWRWAFFVNLAIGLPAIVPARRLLRETQVARGERLPDGAGVALAIVGVGALSLGIVKGPDWGWGDPAVIASLAAGVLLLASFVRRSSRHPSPVVELDLFRVRSFSVANVAVLLFAMGFFAMLLCNVLFLTGVWHWSILKAGVAITPGPLTAAVAAVIGGRLSDRFGQRVVAIPGTLLFAAGTLFFAQNMGATPAYAADFLPATFLTGAGVGLSFAALGSAAVAELPAARFATGSAVAAGFRQLGAVLGISILVAVLGTPHLHEFHDAYLLMSFASLLAGAVAVGLGRVRAREGTLAAEAAA